MKERRAYICEAKDCTPPQRIFLTPDERDYVPKCPDGHGPMKRQVNVVYRKKTKGKHP